LDAANCAEMAADSSEPRVWLTSSGCLSCRGGRGRRRGNLARHHEAGPLREVAMQECAAPSSSSATAPRCLPALISAAHL
jgi:hypothetical protein